MASDSTRASSLASRGSKLWRALVGLEVVGQKEPAPSRQRRPGSCRAVTGLSATPRAQWSCAVVGRSGSLWGSRLGQHIDRHEAVFRVDNAPSGSKFTQDVGKKVTYQVLDPNWAEALLGTASSGSPHVARWWMGTATVVLWSQRSQSQFVQLRYLYPDADILMLRPSIEVLVRSQVEHFASRLREAGLAGPESLGGAAERLGSLLPALAMASRVCDTVEVFGVLKDY